jgi:hypothetical protein
MKERSPMASPKAAAAEHDIFDYDACDGQPNSNRIHLNSFHLTGL